MALVTTILTDLPSTVSVDNANTGCAWREPCRNYDVYNVGDDTGYVNFFDSGVTTTGTTGILGNVKIPVGGHIVWRAQWGRPKLFFQAPAGGTTVFFFDSW